MADRDRERDSLLDSSTSIRERGSEEPPLSDRLLDEDDDTETAPPEIPVRGDVELSDVAPARTIAVRFPPRSNRVEPTPPGLAPQEARERLGRAAAQAAIVFLVVYAVHQMTYSADYMAWARPSLELVHARGFMVPHVVALLTILLSLTVFVSARKRWMPSRVAVDLGLIYYVAVALGISVFEHWEPLPTEYIPIHISWTCLWIPLFPLMVPSSRGKTSLAALSAAATAPVAVIASVALRGTDLPTVQVMIWVTLPPFLAALLAVYPGAAIHRLETAAERARELGSYQLTDLLSRGGMGEVWRAEHRLLARPAAIKLIRPAKFEKASATKRRHVVQRFEREARITASLRSPHTVELYDFGVTEDGSFYNVMELLDGLDLKSLVRQHGPLPPERTIYFLQQACDSMAEAHARKLVHRDIKPANLFACRYGLEVDFLKVLDFGLARTAQPFADRDDRITAEGMTAGTPAYIAPELARGEPDYDHRVDIYGLGCVAYWLVTGRTVFSASSVMAMLHKHIGEPPLAPSQLGFWATPPDLEELILACLEKRPDDRPADAAELRRELEAVAAALETPWTMERARQWWEEHYVPDRRRVVGPEEVKPRG